MRPLRALALLTALLVSSFAGEAAARAPSGRAPLRVDCSIAVDGAGTSKLRWETPAASARITGAANGRPPFGVLWGSFARAGLPGAPKQLALGYPHSGSGAKPGTSVLDAGAAEWSSCPSGIGEFVNGLLAAPAAKAPAFSVGGRVLVDSATSRGSSKANRKAPALARVKLTVTFAGTVEDGPNAGRAVSGTLRISGTTVRSLAVHPFAAPALDAAGARYAGLRETLDAPAARAALVAELSAGWPFVAGAVLDADGTTIALVLADGMPWLLNTNEDSFPSLAASKAAPAALWKKPPPDPPASGNDDCLSNRIAPASHRVLIYYAASVSNGPALSMFEIRDKFEELGWEEDDIDLVYRSGIDDMSVDPDDLTQLAGYGVVVFIGHGGYSGPDGHYIQACSSGEWDDVADPADYAKWWDWYTNRHWLVGHDTIDHETGERVRELSISTRAIAETGQIDPGTMVYLLSCNSFRAEADFEQAGAGSCFSWDGRVDDVRGYQVFQELVEGMAGGGTARSDTEAYAAIADPTSALAGEMRITSEEGDNYLPAWGEITFTPGPAPPGTDHWQLEIPRAGGPLVIDDARPGQVIELDGVAPGPLPVFARAVSRTGGVLQTHRTTVDLAVGPNTPAATSGWATYGVVLSAAPTVRPPDGVSAATITATVSLFAPGDVGGPTGGGVACRSVEFITNLGTFVGPSTVKSDASGRAEARLVSAQRGTATIRAVIVEDGIESVNTVQVVFETDGLHIVISGSEAPFTGDTSACRIESVHYLDFLVTVDGVLGWDWSSPGNNGGLLAFDCFNVKLYGHTGPLRTAFPGMTLKVVLQPNGGAEHPSRITDTWVHWFWGTDYAHQGTARLSTCVLVEVSPGLWFCQDMTGPVELEFVLTDPAD